MIRFKIAQGNDITWTPWVEEPIKSGPGGHTAVSEMSKLRQQYGNDARISIERTTVIPPPERKLFVFDIAVREGRMSIVDKEGVKGVKVDGLTLQSRSFQEAETEGVLAQLKEQFSDATFTRREVRRG